MRKMLIAMAASAALATPAAAQYAGPYAPYYHSPLAVGAAVGTVAGIGAYNGWWGSSAGIPSSFGGSVATGFVAGVGTVALIDAATQPCAGFRALFSPFRGGAPSGCVNGQYAGYAPR